VPTSEPQMIEQHPSAGRFVRSAGARGFTLVEVVVVLVILATIAAFVTTSVASVAEDAREDTTRISLGTLREAILTSYLRDIGELPTTLGDLQRRPSTEAPYDPRTRRGWRGPYVRPTGALYVVGPAGTRGTDSYVDATFTTEYGVAGDPAIHDGYGRPIVLQIPDADGNDIVSAEEARHARLVSAGLDRVIDTPVDELFPSNVGRDDIVLYFEATRAP